MILFGSLKPVDLCRYTQGQYDMVVIIEGTDEACMVSFLKLVSLGNIRSQIMRAFSVDEMKGFISKMS